MRLSPYIVLSCMHHFIPGPIALGCMSLPLHDEALCEKILLRAIELGIRLFDTADLYDKGRNETIVGRILHAKRDQILLATKVGNQWREDGSGWDWNPRKNYILKAVEESLRRLNTDRIDLYQLHGGTIDDPIDEAIDAFETLKASGKILQYGISSIRPNVIRSYVERSSIFSVMCQYGAADRRPEEEVLPLLEKNRIHMLARGVLAKGMLCGKAIQPYLNHSVTDMQHGMTAILQCSNSSRTPAQTAIQYVLHQYGGITAVIGLSQVAQLEEISAAPDTPALSKEEINIISAAWPADRYTEHR